MRQELEPTDRQKSPEYWDGHSADDSCEAYPLHIPRTREFKKALDRDNKAHEQMRRKLEPQIKAVELLKNQIIPLATFKVGDTFIPSQYPHGTILHTSEEDLMARLRRPLELWDRLGFVADTEGIYPEGGNAVVYLLGDSSLTGANLGEILIGEVRHSKYLGSSGNEINYFHRTNSLDVVQIGTSQTDSSRELKRGRFFSLNPFGANV